jgi:N-acylglucosamine-6-phosphate 2-epimerase
MYYTTCVGSQKVRDQHNMTTSYPIIAKLQGGLIVSCQAGPESALHGPVFMGAMAREAERGGAVGLRVDGAADIAAAHKMSTLPILGINKRKFEGYDPYITVTFELAKEAVDAGASLLAMDGTGRDTTAIDRAHTSRTERTCHGRCLYARGGHRR